MKRKDYRALQHLVVIAATTILGLFLANSAFAQIACREIKFSNPNYHEMMDQLAEQAGLPSNYWSRYHEAVVSDLCGGRIRSVDKLVDSGFVKPTEAQAIARVLGKSYKSKRRSENGKTYGYSKERFSEMALCNACADNVAQYYTKKPESRCGRLAKQAIEGNPAAIEKLLAFPDYCKYKY